MNWQQFRARLISQLDDTNRETPTWSDVELLTYFEDGLVFVANTHTARMRIHTIQLPATSSTLTLPDDVLTLGAVAINDGSRRHFLEQKSRQPSAVVPVPVSASSGWEYWLWPENVLNFSNSVPSAYTVELQYWGYWVDAVDDDTDLAYIPRWILEAVKWFMREEAMNKQAIGAAVLGQYKTRIDAGNPEDNPLLQQAKFFRRRFDEALAAHPIQDRNGWEVR